MQLNPNLKNVLSLFFVEFIARFIGFIAVTYLARVMGTDGFGVINIGLAVLSYLMVIATSGLTLSGTKKLIAGNDDPGLLAGNILLTRLVLSVIILILFVLSLFLFVERGETFYVILVYSLYLFPSAILLEWFFHGQQKMDIIAAGRTIGAVSYLLALIVLVRNSGDTVFAGAAWVVGGIVNAFYLVFIFKKRNYRMKFSFSSSIFLRLLKGSFSLSAASIITQLVIQFPVIYLGIALSNSEVGIYSAAYKIIVLILVIDRVFYALFFPKIVQYISNGVENIAETFNRVLKIISVLGLSVLLFSLILAESVISIVFGLAFKGAIPVFMILLGSFYFTLLNSTFTYTLIAMNREKSYVLSLMSGAIVFFISIVILTNYSGTAGSAAAYVLFELTALVIMNMLLSKEASINILRTVALPLIFTLFLKFVVFAFISLPLQVVVAACAGIPMIFYLTGFGTEEIRFIKRIFI